MRPLPRQTPQEIRARIDAWLEAHGGARRFEPGASNDFESVRTYLARHGHNVTFSQHGKVTLSGGGKGRPKTVDVDGLFRFVDELRLADGLQPFLPQVAP